MEKKKTLKTKFMSFVSKLCSFKSNKEKLLKFSLLVLALGALVFALCSCSIITPKILAEETGICTQVIEEEEKVAEEVLENSLKKIEFTWEADISPKKASLVIFSLYPEKLEDYC